MKKFSFFYFVVVLYTFIFANFSHAITNGMSAINVLGRDNTLTNEVAISQEINNAPANEIGFNGPQNTLIDEVGHRLFVSELNRVSVFNLDSDNILTDNIADYVLGQPDFYTDAAASGTSGFNSVQSLAFDQARNLLFVADSQNHRVMVYDVNTITNGEAAVNVLGQTDFNTTSFGTTDSKTYLPSGLFYQASTTKLFVADRGNVRVLIFDLSTITNGEAAVNVLGQTDFISNSSGGGNDKFAYVISLLVDKNNKLYVADATLNRVMVFDVNTITNGEAAVNVLGQPDFTTYTANTNSSGLSYPYGFAYATSSNILYVSDVNNRRVVSFHVSTVSNGEFAVNVLGQNTFTNNSSVTAQDGSIYSKDMAFDNVNQKLYAADLLSQRVLIFDLNTTSNGEDAVGLLGQFGEDNLTPIYTKSSAYNSPNKLSLKLPRDVEIDKVNHRLFVSDYSNYRVLVYNLDANNKPLDRIPDYVLGKSDFHSLYTGAVNDTNIGRPAGLKYDENNNLLYVSDYIFNRVLIFDVSTITNGEAAVNVLGQTSFTGGGANIAANRLNKPEFLELANNKLFVSDYTNKRVMVFDVSTITNGEAAVNVLGKNDFISNTPTTVTQNNMNSPLGLAVNSDKTKLFVSDSGPNRVLVFDITSITDGENAVNVIGQSNFTSSAIILDSSHFSSPSGLAYDTNSNNLFISDKDNDRVMVFDVSTITNGEVAVNVIGADDFIGNSSTSISAKLDDPEGVDVDENGNLYIADSNYNRVVLFDVNLSLSLSSITPNNNNFIISSSTDLKLNFNQNVKLQNGGLVNLKDINGNVVKTATVPNVDLSASGTEIIWNVKNLSLGSEFYLEMSSSTVKSSSTNIFYSGISNSSTFKFYTIPSYSFSGTSLTVNENIGTTTIPILFSSKNATTTNININISGGTATSTGISTTTDYTFSTGTLTFSSSSSFIFYLPLNIADDTLVESPETIIFVLNTPSTNSEFGTTTTFTINITDNDTVTSSGGGGGFVGVTSEEQSLIATLVQNMVDTTIKKSDNIKDFSDKKIIITKENLENILSDAKAVSEIARSRFAIDEEGNSVIGLDNCAPGIPLRATYNGKMSPFKVKELQRFLNTEGNIIPVTGIFHTMTITAIKKFQKKYSLKETGEWLALEHNLASKLKCGWKNTEEILAELGKNTKASTSISTVNKIENKNTEILSCNNNFKVTLRAGSKNTAEIKKMQTFLEKDLKIKTFSDHVFGIRTENAVKNFQKKNKIEDTGLWGTKTRERANKLLCQ